MKIDILTLFPEMFAPLKTSVLAKAEKKGLIEINIIDIRPFSKDKHKKCDDYSFGGGAGMLMTPQPLYDAIMSVKKEDSVVVLTSPRGKTFNQAMAKEMSTLSHIIFVCGHYEGVDERIIELCVDREISIGDFVLTGGEIPAMAMVDAVLRLVPGVISSESLGEESFENGLLEYPQYTRPAEFMGLKVPEVLLSGNHAEIEKWRLQQSKLITEKRRKDLRRGEK